MLFLTRHPRFYKQIITITSLSIMSIATVYASSTQVDRYLSVANKPLPAQKDLLTQTRQVNFPTSIHTIGDAIHYWLMFSGYTLSSVAYKQQAIRAMLTASLPEVDRSFGPMNLKDGLETLASESFILLVDPIHRSVSFELKASYQDLYAKKRPVVKKDQEC